MKINHRTPMLILASAVFLCAPLACSKATSPEASHDHIAHDHDHDHAEHNDAVVRTDAYENIKGVIVALPTEGDANSHLKIHHEHIPTFITKAGEVNINRDGSTGMRSMTMEFPLAEGVTLDGLNADDKIKFSFVVNWGGTRAWEITAIEKLPADAEVSFENKPTPDGLMPDDAAHHMPAAEDDHDDHSGHDHGDEAP